MRILAFTHVIPTRVKPTTPTSTVPLGYHQRWVLGQVKLNVRASLLDGVVGNRCMQNKNKNLRTRNDLSMEMHSNKGESMSTYPRRPKRKRFTTRLM